jgi:hypothetical protein
MLPPGRLCEVCQIEPAVWLMLEKYPERNTPAKALPMCEEDAWGAFEADEYEADDWQGWKASHPE